MTASTPSARVPLLTWFSLAACGAFAFSIAAGPALGDAGSFRYPGIALGAALFLAWLRWPAELERPLERRALVLLLGGALAWLEAASVSHYLAFSINGVDFSVFDWMLENTLEGRVGQSTLYAGNHLGVHSSFLLLALVPLHALVRTPWLLIILGPLVLWAGVFPLLRLARALTPPVPGVLTVALVLAWLTNAWVGRLVNLGFRIETLVPPLSLVFLAGWVEKRRALWALAALGLLLTKEDTALTLAAFALAALAVERPRWRQAAALLLACVAWLGVYTLVLQPRLLGQRPEYGGFWSAFGATPGEALVGMLSHPLAVLRRVATSGLWSFFAPVLFLPWRSPRAGAAMLPATLLLGTATYEYMHDFGGYYASPLVAFALFGLLELRARWSGGARWRGALVLAVLVAFPCFVGGYATVMAVDASRLRGVASARAVVASSARLCAQTIIVPHLGYPRGLAPLFDGSCADVPGTTTLVHPALDPWPLGEGELRALIDGWRRTRDVTELEGGFLLVR